MVVDLNPGPKSSSPTNLIAADGRLYFTARDDQWYGVWQLDGTRQLEGDQQRDGIQQRDGKRPIPTRACEFPADTELSVPAGLSVAQGLLLFSGRDPKRRSQSQMFLVETAPAGATEPPPLAQPLRHSDPQERYEDATHFVTAGDLTYFITRYNELTVREPDNRRVYETGAALWRTDGTIAGTVRLLGVGTLDQFAYQRARPGSQSGLLAAALGQSLLFAGRDAKHGEELWHSDGTPTGTTLLADSKNVTDSNPGEVVAAGAVDFLVIGDNTYASTNIVPTLYRTDGTAAGTVPVEPAAGGPLRVRDRELFVFDNAVYFIGTQGQQTRLWRSDGTAAGTVPAADVPIPPNHFGSEVQIAVGEQIYFHGEDNVNGHAIWSVGKISDGQPAPAAGLVHVLAPPAPPPNRQFQGGFAGPRPQHRSPPIYLRAMATLGPRLVFVTPQATESDEGDQNPPDPNPANPNPANPDPPDPNLAEHELWQSEGTPAGTVSIQRYKKVGEGLFTSLVQVHARLCFLADDGKLGKQLWCTDGTAQGTLPLTHFEGQNMIRTAPQLAEDGNVYFLKWQQGNQLQQWRSDGTPEATVAVPEHEMGLYGRKSVMLRGVQYFTSQDREQGHRLWKTDGTPAGTVLVAKLPSQGDVSGILFVTPYADHLYFTADDGVTGRELWRTDGTQGGTVPVADLRPGPEGSAPRNLSVAHGRLYFSADDGVHGRELFVLELP